MRTFSYYAAAAGVLLTATTLPAVMAQTTAAPAGRTSPAAFKITRASLAPVAAFTFTQTVAPKNGTKTTLSGNVQIKNSKARADYNDPSLGSVRYLASETGAYLYIPGNKSAIRYNFKGGADAALQLAYRAVASDLSGFTKAGVATVSGQPTDVYKNAQTGQTVYIGKKAGFRLPVKAVRTNEGGTTTFLVSNIRLNVPVSDAVFALPPGTQVVDGQSGGGFPGGGR